jgi:hypothetical protein
MSFDDSHAKLMTVRLDELATKLDKGWDPTASTTVRQAASEIDETVRSLKLIEEAKEKSISDAHLKAMEELYDALEGALSSRGYEGEDYIDNYAGAKELIDAARKEGHPDAPEEMTNG